MIGHYTEGDICVIVFTTKNNCRLLNTASYWLMDGTFKSSPTPFVQIYSIHAVVGTTDEGTDKVVPLVYGLLSHKTEKSYSIFFEILKRFVFHKLNINLSPTLILTDFETAAINAVKQAFPSCLQKLCFFHLSQSIWRHIQASGLAQRYGKDAIFAHKLRHVAALAFLEPNEIPDAFNIIRDEVLPSEAEKIVTWFERYYVRGTMKISKSISSKTRRA